jgi:hypothetical protein
MAGPRRFSGASPLGYASFSRLVSFGEFIMHFDSSVIFWLKIEAVKLVTKMKAALQQKPATSITVGDNNSGNFYSNCHLHFQITPSAPQLAPENPSAPSIESN